MHEESTASAKARSNIRRLAAIIETTARALDAAFTAPPPRTDDTVPFLLIQLMNVAHRLREESQIVMDQECLRIRQDRAHALDAALHVATATAP